ncbi:Inner membrane protein ybhI [Raoultella planticola]|uniref:Inner membrane protein ybhI n=1 Tax=Raoultella planticola TaxID=575 RepID=A0A485CFD8_RAOPL|nr:Inner membrane protein ybhI [Raoultella planticola]
MGAVTMIALIVSAFLGVTPLSPGKSDKVAALSGFANGTIWLIGIAMFISRAVIKTGLGKRVALWFISKCGSSMLGVAYGLALSDVVLGPGIPSASARAVELCTRLRSPLPRRTSQNLARRREKPAPF